jgi:hypothetical protein
VRQQFLGTATTNFPAVGNDKEITSHFISFQGNSRKFFGKKQI